MPVPRKKTAAGKSEADEAQRRHASAALDEGLRESFPASDPVAVAVTRVAAPLVCTIGHSTRPIAEFVALLKDNGIVRVLDVRTVPRSRHNPQFNRDALPATLAANGMTYTHLPGLGGLRHARSDSVNGGWHNLSFRGYADYMQSPEFADNMQQLTQLARSERCVLMCAEAVPWRCHRSMIGDTLLVRGFRVEDIMEAGTRRPHALTSFAQVDGTTITYPPTGDGLQQAALDLR